MDRFFRLCLLTRSRTNDQTGNEHPAKSFYISQPFGKVADSRFGRK